MKPKEIVYGKIKISISREIVVQIIGLALIGVSAFLLGLFDFTEMQFDFSVILTSEYWINYFTRLIVYYIAFIGMYLLARTKKLEAAAIVTHRCELKEHRAWIVENKLIEELDIWLNKVYGLKIAIIGWKYDVERKYKKAKDSEEELQRFKKEYARIAEYEALLSARERKDVAAEEELLKTLEPTCKELQRHNPHVHYNNLFNVDYDIDDGDESIYVNEPRLIFRKILPMLSIGMIAMAAFYTILPPIFKPVSASSLMNLAFSMFFLLLYCFNGARIATEIVNVNIYNADNVRLSICERFKIYNSMT